MRKHISLFENPRRYRVKKKGKGAKCVDRRSGRTVAKGKRRGVASYCYNLAKRVAKPAYRSKTVHANPTRKHKKSHARKHARKNPGTSSAVKAQLHSLKNRVAHNEKATKQLKTDVRELAVGTKKLASAVKGLKSHKRSGGHKRLGSGRK
jgi:hypothetical protein